MQRLNGRCAFMMTIKVDDRLIFSDHAHKDPVTDPLVGGGIIQALPDLIASALVNPGYNICQRRNFLCAGRSCGAGLHTEMGSYRQQSHAACCGGKCKLTDFVSFHCIPPRWNKSLCPDNDPGSLQFQKLPNQQSKCYKCRLHS